MIQLPALFFADLLRKINRVIIDLWKLHKKAYIKQTKASEEICFNYVSNILCISIKKVYFTYFDTIILLTISRYRDTMQVKGDVIRCRYYQDFTELLSVCIFSSHSIIRRISTQFTVITWLQFVLMTVLF